MKRKISAICICLIGCFLTGCISTQKAPDEKITKRFTFIAPLENNTYWNNVAKGIVDGCYQYNISIKCVGSVQLNEEEQIEFINSAIAAKVDGIITTAVDSTEFKDVITEAKEQNIPVVLVDNDDKNSERSIYIGTDNYQAGYLAGKEMAAATNGTANIGIIISTQSTSNQRERMRGFEDAIVTYMNMKIKGVIEGKSELLLISEKTNEFLEENSNVDAIFCAEGNGGVALGELLGSDIKKLELTIIAFDDVKETLDNIKSGNLYATIVQDTYKMGYEAVKYLEDYSNGAFSDKEAIYTDVSIVKEENIQDFGEEKWKGKIEWYSY